jgi:sulfite reductase alpha subunit-like flavoprotein
MVSMTVTVSSSLTDPDYPRIKRFVWLALPEGTTYRTGDHLTVLPTNDDDTPVVMIAAGTGLAPFRGAIADRRGITAEVVTPRKNQAQRR